MHIHRPKDNVSEKLPDVEVKSKDLYYGPRKKVVNKPEKDTYAAKQVVDGIIAYSVITQRNHLYNPFSNLGLKEYCWKPVKKNVFDLYVDFLNTQRETYLNEAEREYAHG